MRKNNYVAVPGLTLPTELPSHTPEDVLVQAQGPAPCRHGRCAVPCLAMAWVKPSRQGVRIARGALCLLKGCGALVSAATLRNGRSFQMLLKGPVQVPPSNRH